MKPEPKLVYPNEGALYVHPRPLLPVEVYMYNGIENEEAPDRVIARFYGEGKGTERLLSAVSLAELFVDFYNYVLEEELQEANDALEDDEDYAFDGYTFETYHLEDW